MWLAFGIARYILFFTIMAILIAVFGVMLVIFFPFVILILFCI